MNERDMPDDEAGTTTDTPAGARPAGARRAIDKLSVSAPAEDDTEGQGGKVFAVEQAEAEAAARD